MTSTYKDNAQSWDTCILVLTYSTLHRSKITLSWPNFIIQTAIPTNLNLPVHLNYDLKGSDASKCLSIGPILTLESTIFLSLTKVWFDTHQVLIQTQIYLCKKYL